MASFNLGDIFTTVKVKSDGFKEALGGVKDLADESQKSNAKLGNMAAGFQDFAKKAGAVLVTVGTGLTLYAKQATDFTVDFVKSSRTLAREIGTSVAEASRLTYAFSRLGMSQEEASTSLGIFSKRINETSQNSNANRLALQNLQLQIEKTKREISSTTEEIRKNGDKSGELGLKLRGLQNDLATLEEKVKKNGTALDQLGISVKNADGTTRSFKEILFAVADKFKEMPDGPEKTALAMDLFGRSGKDMIKVLNQGGEGIQKLEDAADKLGITLTDKTVDGVMRLIESQKKLKENSDAIKLAVGTLTAPVLASFNEKIAALLGNFQNLNEPMKTAAANILAFGGPVATGSGALLEWVGNLGAAKETMSGFNLKALQGIPIVGSFASAFQSALSFIGNPWVLAIIAIVAATALLLEKFGLLRPMIDWTKEAVMQIWNAFMVALKPAIDSIKSSLAQLQPVFDMLLPVLKWVAIIIGGTIIAAIVSFVAILAVLTAVGAYTVAAVLGFFNRLRQETVDKFNAIKNTILEFANAGKLGIALFVSGVLGIWNQLSALPGRIGAWIGGVAGSIRGGLQGALNAVTGFVGNFLNAGKGLIDAVARGVQNAIGGLVNAVKGGLDKVRRLLPFSDAKEGPLSDLTLSGKRLMTTLGEGVTRGQDTLYQKVERAFGGLPTAMLNGEVNGGQASLGSQIARMGEGTNTIKAEAPRTFQQENNFYIDKIDSEERAQSVIKQISRNQELAAKGIATQQGAVGPVGA